MNTKARKLISFDELLPKFGITDSRTTLARKMAKKPPQFPRCVRSASGARINWFEDEVAEHVASLERGNADNYRAKKAGQ
jgi:predicted DNA-binding transcriptional regulator AlpA